MIEWLELPHVHYILKFLPNPVIFGQSIHDWNTDSGLVFQLVWYTPAVHFHDLRYQERRGVATNCVTHALVLLIA